MVASLLAACSNDSSDDPRNDTTPASVEDGQIRFNADVWQVLPGTARRAATFDDVAALQTEGSFKCAAYNAGTLTSYIPETTVNWNGETLKWAFSGHYYWPLPATNGGIYPSLDFFGYIPASKPSYITAGPTYTADHNVAFTCTDLPMTNTGQATLKEFMFAVAVGQNYTSAGVSGVPLIFQHPFARIKLQLAASHPDVTINRITLKGIKKSGSFQYTHSTATSAWTPSGDPTDFVLTLTGDAAVFDNNPATTKPIGEYYLMIPQDWAGVIEVDADCLFWGDKKNYPALTTTIPTTWQPGKSYTYTLNISPDDLKVNIEKFTEQW